MSREPRASPAQANQSKVLNTQTTADTAAFQHNHLSWETSDDMSPNIFISAGEASGEHYGALLIDALKLAASRGEAAILRHGR